MSDLKPCPHCGAKAKITGIHETRDGRVILWSSRDYPNTTHWVKCTNKRCTREAHHKTEAEAIAAWNRRADGWVSVEERLPGALVWVWCWRHLKWTDAPASCGMIAMLTEEGEWQAMVSGGVGFKEVTHWRPLPDPPESTA